MERTSVTGSRLGTRPGCQWPSSAESSLPCALPLLVLGTARALGLDAATTRLSVILLLFIPQLVHLTGLVNNDNLMILAGAMVTFLLARVLGGDGSLRTAISSVLPSVSRPPAKGFALILLPITVAVYAHVGLRRHRLSQFTRHGLWVGGIALLAGGWWWVRNIWLYGSLQPRYLASPVETPGPAESLGRWVRAFGIRFVDGFWGRFGTRMRPSLVS